MTRYIVLLRRVEPLHGLCPACDRPLDEGCRVTRAAEITSDPRGTGIRMVLEVECEGTPAHPVVACPCGGGT